MDHFRTIVSMTSKTLQMGLYDKILTLGSCFAHSMGERMAASKMMVMANPFGVLYNPHAIHKALRYALFNEMPPSQTFLQHQDVFLNYDFHSEISALNPEKLQQTLKQLIGSVHYYLRDTSWLILTYGTAWQYIRKDTGESVANCHKMPGHDFEKVLLNEQQIVDSFEALRRELMTFNPQLKIILTVSPVRHIKDTLELNSVSKAVLRTACHTLSTTHPNVDYFPAYEMMLDDLRDYRYYKADLIHPTEVAEDYIWQHFAHRYFSEALKKFVDQWSDIRAALEHRPFHVTSEAHQRFLRDTLKKLEDLQATVPLEKEIAFVKSQLS
jgi:hypothetical protein